MDAEDFAALRKEAQPHRRCPLPERGSRRFYGELPKQHKQPRNSCTEAVKVLQDAIPDWSNETYSDIRSYAVAQGLPEEQVNVIVDPAVIQIINKARLFDQESGSRPLEESSNQKKVLRSRSRHLMHCPSQGQIDKQRAALRNNRGTDLEDIASVLMSRWEA